MNNDLLNIIDSQSQLIDDIKNGKANKVKKEETNMAKKKTKQLTARQLAPLIKADILGGLTKKEICNLRGINMGKLMNVINSHLSNDPDIIKFRESEQNAPDIALSKNEQKVVKEIRKVEAAKKEEEKKDLKPNKPYNSGNPMPDDIKIKIAEDYDSGNYTQKELAKKYYCSDQTVYVICKSLISKERLEEIKKNNLDKGKHKAEATRSENRKNQKKIVDELKKEYKKKKKIQVIFNKKEEDKPEVVTGEIVEEKKEPEVHKNYGQNTFAPVTNPASFNIFDTDLKSDLIEVKQKDTYILCGLIADRHEMGTIPYIINKIPHDKVLDIEWIRSKIREFINRHIDFKDGIPYQGLNVRFSGLQTAYTALIAECLDKHINLISSHHNEEGSEELDNVYLQYHTINMFPMHNYIPHNIAMLSGQVGQLFTYKSKPAEYENIDEFYEINIEYRPEECRRMKNVSTVAPTKSMSILTTNARDTALCSSVLDYTFMMDQTQYRAIKKKRYYADSSRDLGYSYELKSRSYI